MTPYIKVVSTGHMCFNVSPIYPHDPLTCSYYDQWCYIEPDTRAVREMSESEWQEIRWRSRLR